MPRGWRPSPTAPGDRRHGVRIVAASLAALGAQAPVIYNAHNFESGFRPELTAGARLGLHARALRRFERGLSNTPQRPGW